MREGALMRPLIVLSCALSLLVPILAWWDLPVPGRIGLAIAFVLLVPGAPLAIILIRRSGAVLWALIPALSLSLVTLLTVAQVTTGTWSAPAAATILGLGNVACTAFAWNRTPPLRITRPVLRRPGHRRIVSAVALFIAVALWWAATTSVDLDAAGAAGLVTVLPWTYWLALILAVSVAVFAITSKPAPDGVMAAIGVAVLAVMVATFVGIADGGSPVGTAYVHVGFVDWISQTGTLREAMDARFSWPGFFTAASAVTGWAGLADATPFVVFFPVLAVLLSMAPVYVIGMAVFRDRAVAWTGVLLFVLGNWVQQDYFAPQAVAFPLMLTVIAVLLWQTSETGIPAGTARGWRRFLEPMRRTPARLPGYSACRALMLEAALLVIASAIVVSHQLTPVSLIVVLLLLSVLGATRSRTLWFGVSVVFATWFAFGATDWWTGHLSVLIDGFGRLDEAVGAGVVERVSGDPAYQAMQAGRIGWSALFAIAGLVGWWVTRGGRLPMPVTAALVVAPVSLVLGQPYGGEVVLRVYLYALPILAVLAAGGIAPLIRARSALSRVALMLIMVLAAAGVTTARGVNVAFERTPADVLEVARAVLWETPTGSTIRPLATEGALRVARIGDLHHPPSVDGDGTAFERLLQQAPDVVFLTTMRERYEQITRGARPGWYENVATLLEASGQYQVTHRTEHVIVLERIPGLGEDE